MTPGADAGKRAGSSCHTQVMRGWFDPGLGSGREGQSEGSCMRVSWARLLGFAALYCAMYFGLSSLWGDGLSRRVIDDATVRPAAWLAGAWTGDATVSAQGAYLSSSSATLHVLFGCEGTDVLMLLVAAMLVAPIGWRWRLAGILAGSIWVFAINQARVLALFLALRSEPSWFGTLHGLVAPVAVALGTALFFVLWLRRAGATGEGIADRA